MRRVVRYICILLALPAAAWAKNPPPDFTSYRLPSPLNPGPRPEAFGLVDVAVLAAMLVLTAHFALRRRSRREIRVLAVFSLLYFGFYRHGCVCSVGSVQNVALALGPNGYVLPLTVGAFFLLPLLAALFFGRVFCAAVCPLGAAQDFLQHRQARVPAWLDALLGSLPYVYLGGAALFAALGSAFIICQYDPFIAFFRLGGSTTMLTLGAAMLLLSTVVGRPYCRYLCPYGVLLRWAAPFARWQVRVSPAECVQCHLCAGSCPYGAIKAPAPATSAADRAAGRRTLAKLVALLPVLVLGMALLGWKGGAALARMDNTVDVAERVWLEEHGRVAGTTEASQAFRALGEPDGALYARAAAIRRRYDWGGALFGAWVGLVAGLRLIAVSIRRGRRDYEADPAACVSCARCYRSCPVGQAEAAAPILTTVGEP